jgi:hypothetical protein
VFIYNQDLTEIPNSMIIGNIILSGDAMAWNKRKNKMGFYNLEIINA